MYKNINKENLDEIKTLVTLISNRIENLVFYFKIEELTNESLKKHKELIGYYLEILKNIHEQDNYDREHSNSVQSFLDSAINFQTYLGLYITKYDYAFLESLNDSLVDSVMARRHLKKQEPSKIFDFDEDLPF